MSLTDYRSLGRSGLIVSPLALGTMTFGAARWGSDEDGSRAVFDAYVEAGGNFVDTANIYSGGRSEEMLGRFIGERQLRDEMVVATKAGFAAGKGLLAGGNGAKHIFTSIENSLRRLQTDYVDLFWVHLWDSVTPAEELLDTMAALVHSGKARYWGISNTPAWYAAKLATLAAARGLPGPIALQYFYSLVNRDIEDEHVPLAAEFGMGILPWSPLAYGLLGGKYNRDATAKDQDRPQSNKRLEGPNPFGDTLFSDRNWKIVDVLRQVADEAGQTPARIALSWVVGRPGITSTLMGVSRAEQLSDNVAALDVVLSAQHRAALDAVSAPDPRMLYSLFTPGFRGQVIFGGKTVKAWRD